MPTEWLSDEQIARLLSSATEPRTAVLLHMLAIEGFGLGEIIALDHGDITGTRQSLSAELPRQGRPQSFALHTDTCAALLALRRANGSEGPLLTSQRSAETGSRISRFGADYLIKQAAAAAGVGPVSANVLRRSHAGAAERSGVHILDTRDRMGHRDVRTTHRHLPDGLPHQR